MAGPKFKQGLDYFPMATRKDKKFKVIRALHGDTGYVILNTLLQDIHGEKGYFVEWSEKEAKYFAFENHFNYETTIAVIRDCLIENIFDEDKFHAYKILTSVEIQQIWVNVARERKEIIFEPDYLLIDISRYLKKRNKREENRNPKNIESYKEENFPKEFTNYYQENDLTVNSNNPPDNLIKPPDNRERKQAEEAEEAKEAKEEKEVKQGRKKSEAFNFSHSANFFSLEKKKKILIGKNERKTEKNFLNQNEGSVENFKLNTFLNQEKLFEELPPVNKNSEEKGKNSNDSSTQIRESGESKKHKKEPHPTRSEIIKSWERKFGQSYENCLSGNEAINQIINHSHKLIRRAREGDIGSLRKILLCELWNAFWNNCEKLEKFYHNLIRFESVIFK